MKCYNLVCKKSWWLLMNKKFVHILLLNNVFNTIINLTYFIFIIENIGVIELTQVLKEIMHE